MGMLDFMGGSWQSFAIDGSVYTSGNKYQMGDNYSWNRMRIWRWTPSNATAHVSLPDPTVWGVREGGPVFYMENLDAATFDIEIYTAAGTSLGTLTDQATAATNKCVVFCLDASADTWAAFACVSTGLVKLT